jgi:beta-phosphoglucomutase family hydrolase
MKDNTKATGHTNVLGAILPKEENNVKAVIWDMDGVIADTASLHFQSWQFAFQKRGIIFNREDFNHHFGQRNDTIIRSRLGHKGSDSEIEAIATEKEESFRREAEHKLTAFPGVINLLKTIKNNGFTSAIASSAPLENIRLILDKLGITEYFQAIVYGKEVSEGKPSPQVFLLAAQKLGAEPGDCIVVEDSIAGVIAAKKAGMHCIAVTNTHPTDKLTDADMVVNSLVLVGVDDLNKLFSLRRNMERTLILVKPDAMRRNLGGAILARFESRGLKMVALRMLQVDEALANRHYAVHQGKSFFKDLIEYITSYPIIAAVFQGQNAIEIARQTMGATDPGKAEPGTIRRDYGMDIQRNSVHGSDSTENAEIEIKLYFSDEEIWINDEI